MLTFQTLYVVNERLVVIGSQMQVSSLEVTMVNQVKTEQKPSLTTGSANYPRFHEFHYWIITTVYKYLNDEKTSEYIRTKKI
jgi:hypothetical protein